MALSLVLRTMQRVPEASRRPVYLMIGICIRTLPMHQCVRASLQQRAFSHEYILEQHRQIQPDIAASGQVDLHAEHKTTVIA